MNKFILSIIIYYKSCGKLSNMTLEVNVIKKRGLSVE